MRRCHAKVLGIATCVHGMVPQFDRVGFFALGFGAVFTKFMLERQEIRPRNPRHFHYTPPEHRPAMREKLGSERSVLLEKLAAL